MCDVAVYCLKALSMGRVEVNCGLGAAISDNLRCSVWPFSHGDEFFGVERTPDLVTVDCEALEAGQQLEFEAVELESSELNSLVVAICSEDLVGTVVVGASTSLPFPGWVGLLSRLFSSRAALNDTSVDSLRFAQAKSPTVSIH